MIIKALRSDLTEYLTTHLLLARWKKVKRIFEKDLRHPSLHTELLEPRWRGIYSFRINHRYRALFFIVDGQTEVFAITNHYKK